MKLPGIMTVIHRLTRLVMVTIPFLWTLMDLSAAPPADYIEAKDLCDHADLRPVEGLWTYPEDDVTVLIFRNEDKVGIYDIYVVEAADCSLSSGMLLGELHASADPDKFTIRMFTAFSKGRLTLPMEAVAIFSENKEALTVRKGSRFRFRFNPNRLLPAFWRMVSVTTNPGESAPEGMIKIYPTYDGNGSTRRAPRYL